MNSNMVEFKTREEREQESLHRAHLFSDPIMLNREISPILENGSILLTNQPKNSQIQYRQDQPHKLTLLEQLKLYGNGPKSQMNPIPKESLVHHDLPLDIGSHHVNSHIVTVNQTPEEKIQPSSRIVRFYYPILVHHYEQRNSCFFQPPTTPRYVFSLSNDVFSNIVLFPPL